MTDEHHPPDRILAGLHDPDFRIRAAAITALGQLGGAVVEGILPSLADDYPQVRAAAILALERLWPEGQWRQSLKYECYVPAGQFIMGAGREAHVVDLAAFYIGRYPVTNADYKRYMDDLGRAFQVPPGKENHPVTGVSWYDARDYAAWAGMRLLTEAEWEKAASWQPAEGSVWDRLVCLVASDRPAGRKRRYPWGNRFDPRRCNTLESGLRGTTPVGNYSPQGDSPYGCADMAGNVWEWTSTRWGKSYAAPAFPYPYRADDGREDPHSPDDRVLRGGSFGYVQEGARTTARFRSFPHNRYGINLGFRLGLTIPG